MKLIYTKHRGQFNIWVPLRNYPTPFLRSTMLTILVPGSVADMHRNREWYRNYITIPLHRTKSYTQALQEGSQAAYFITQRNSYVVTQVPRRRLGHKGNPIYASFSASKS